MRRIIILMLAVMAAASTGCLKKMSSLVGVNVEVVDEKTLLERQILGSYEALSQDLVLVASVRSVDDKGRLVPLPDLPPGQRKALNAMRVQEFYRDDVDRLKASGVLGEDNKGHLQIRKQPTDPQNKQLADTLVKTVNEARDAIVERILETNEHLEPGDRARVEATFASVHQDAAKAGEWIQAGDGQWSRKGGA